MTTSIYECFIDCKAMHRSENAWKMLNNKMTIEWTITAHKMHPPKRNECWSLSSKCLVAFAESTVEKSISSGNYIRFFTLANNFIYGSFNAEVSWLDGKSAKWNQ